MALNFKHNSSRRFTNAEVLQIRNEYFIKLRSRANIAKDYNCSSTLIQKVVMGFNGYAQVQDNIPQKVKDNRKPGNQVSGITKLKKESRYWK